jgi:hypothetical protein
MYVCASNARNASKLRTFVHSLLQERRVLDLEIYQHFAHFELFLLARYPLLLQLAFLNQEAVDSRINLRNTLSQLQHALLRQCLYFCLCASNASKSRTYSE